MRSLLCLLAVAACGGSSGPPLLVHTQFTVTNFTGHGPSPLDPLQGQVIDFTVQWSTIESNNGDGSDPAGCHSTTVGITEAKRTASGSTAALVQSQILDMLPNWDLHLQLCDGGGSSITLVSVIDALNLSIGCFGLPPSAQRKDGAGNPSVTSFEATMCSSTILDVSNNRDVGGDNFSMTIETGPDHLP